MSSKSSKRGTQVFVIDQFNYLASSALRLSRSQSACDRLESVDRSVRRCPRCRPTISRIRASSSIGAALQQLGDCRRRTYHLIRDASHFTLAGSYGILRFLDPGNIESNDTIFSAGYDFTRRKTTRSAFCIALRIIATWAIPESDRRSRRVSSHYGHKITGRTVSSAFRRAGNHTYFEFRCGDAETAFRLRAEATSRTRLPRTNLSANYNHGVIRRQRQFSRVRDDRSAFRGPSTQFDARLDKETSVLVTHAIAVLSNH